MKKVLKAVALAAVAALAVSCGSTKVVYTEEEFNQAFVDEDYGACVSMIQSSKKKDKHDAVLNSLDVNMLMHLNGDYLNSAKAFMDTQVLMQQSAEDTSGGKAFAAAIAGENSVRYSGNVYERILAYSMRAVNALALGDVSNAKGVMDNYTGDYKDIIAPLVAAQKELEAESDGCLEDEKITTSLDVLGSIVGAKADVAQFTKDKPAKSDRIYETSPFLSYLGTVIYAANGDSGHAKDFASALYADNADVDVSEDVAVPAGKGRLNVIALSGTIGKRTEGSVSSELGIIPFINAPMKFKITYPVFDAQTHAIDMVRVTLSDGVAEPAMAMLIEDFDKAVEADVKFKASGAFGRSVFRNITKNAASVATSVAAVKVAEEAMNKASNPVAQVATLAAYNAAIVAVSVGLNAIIEAEKADVRQCSYFPHKASAAGFTVEPGTYSATVEYLSRDGSVIATKELNDIVVMAGKPTVVVSSCAK